MNSESKQRKLTLRFANPDALLIDGLPIHYRKSVLALFPAVTQKKTRPFVVFGTRILTDPRNVYALPEVTDELRKTYSKVAYIEDHIELFLNPQNKNEVDIPDLPDVLVQQCARIATIQADIESKVNPFLVAIEEKNLLAMTSKDFKKWCVTFLERLEDTILDKHTERGLKGINRNGFLKRLDEFLATEELKLKAEVKHADPIIKKDVARGMQTGLTLALASQKTKKTIAAPYYPKKGRPSIAETVADANKLVQEYCEDFFPVTWTAFEISAFASVMSLFEMLKNIKRYNSIRKKQGKSEVIPTGELEVYGELKRISKDERLKGYSDKALLITPKVLLDHIGLSTDPDCIKKALNFFEKLSEPVKLTGIDYKKGVKTEISRMPFFTFNEIRQTNLSDNELLNYVWRFALPSPSFVFKIKRGVAWTKLPYTLIKHINQTCHGRRRESVMKAALMIYSELDKAYDAADARAKKEARERGLTPTGTVTAEVNILTADLGIDRHKLEPVLPELQGALEVIGINTTLEDYGAKAQGKLKAIQTRPISN